MRESAHGTSLAISPEPGHVGNRADCVAKLLVETGEP